MWTQIVSKVYFLLTLLSFPPLFAIALLIFLLTFLFDRKLVLLQKYSCFWGSVYTWFMPRWHVETIGRDKIRPKGTYIVVCNHQSLLDILVLYRLFFHFKFVSKSELFKIPFVGWNMALNRYIRIARGNKKSIKKMMNACEKTLKQGSSILIFPEGTRSRDGVMKPFKSGAFITAKKLQIPILPIVIKGTPVAMPKGDFAVRKHHYMKIMVLDEIAAETIEKQPVETTVKTVHQSMKNELAAMNK